MEGIEEAANKLIEKMNITLPELKKVEYEVAFDYQDKAFGTGVKIAMKQ